MYKTLIHNTQLHENLNNPNFVIVDCRFSLADPDGGQKAYTEAHIPNAVYAHLDRDLSAPVIPGKTGRHPLPNPEKLVDFFSSLGIDEQTQVVAYDDGHGGIAARLWWLLKWMGHENVAVLEGGWTGWTAKGYPVSNAPASVRKRQFSGHPGHRPTVTLEDMRHLCTNPEFRVIDSRAAERYRGEVEPIDPVAGHIPGAISAPFIENLDDSGHFLPPEKLAARFQALTGKTPPDHTIFYCGSGVTACHNLLAYEHAGLGIPVLYPGSWSEWITRPDNPVETGNSGHIVP